MESNTSTLETLPEALKCHDFSNKNKAHIFVEGVQGAHKSVDAICKSHKLTAAVEAVTESGTQFGFASA